MAHACVALALLTCTTLTAARALAAEAPDAQPAAPGLDGRAIMLKVEASPRGKDLSARAVWRLFNSSRRERVRETRFYRLEAPQADELRARWLLVFDAPPDVRDTALLVWNPKAAEERPSQWIYLASYRKVKRIAAGASGSAFLGTEFSFEDLTERLADDDSHALLRAEPIGSVNHFVVESTPREKDSPYAKRIQWVDPESWTVSRIDFHGPQGELEKTLRSQWSRVGGAWVAVRLEMENQRNGHRTLVEVSEPRVDTGLSEEIFAVSRIERGGR